MTILPRAKVPTCYEDTNVKFKSVVIGFKCLLLTETIGKQGHDKLTTAVCEIMKVRTHSVTRRQKLRRICVTMLELIKSTSNISCRKVILH